MTTHQRRRRLAVAVAIGGLVLVLAYAACAVLQILIWNPLAAVPNRSLTEILRDVAASGDSFDTSSVFVIMSAGPLLALALLVFAARSRTPDPWLTALLALGLLTFGWAAYFVASFGAGMALADTYFIGGGDYAPWGRLLFAVSAVALAALILLSALGVRRGWSSKTNSMPLPPPT